MTLEQWLSDRGLGNEDLVRWNAAYNFFDESVTIPVYDFDGVRVLDIVRSLRDGNIRYSKQPQLCRPSTVVYGLNRAYLQIKKANYVVVTEGCVDTWALYRDRVTNSVSVLTSAVSQTQLAWLELFTSNILIWADGDEAGEDFKKRSLKMSKLVTAFSVPNMDPAQLLGMGHSPSKVIQTAFDNKSMYSSMEISKEGNLLKG